MASSASNGNQTCDDAELDTLCQAFDRVCCINLKRRSDRWESFLARTGRVLGYRGRPFIEQIERFEAVDGRQLLPESWCESCLSEWDASNNAKYDRNIVPPYIKKMTAGEIGCALSHVALWRKLANDNTVTHVHNPTMLVLEDDAVFYPGNPPKGLDPGFVEAFSSAYNAVTPQWDVLYLGFCNFGAKSNAIVIQNTTIPVAVYRPTYGFYTHAYAITKSAASKLLSQLPVSAPLDVWLCDNNWFGLNVMVCQVPMPGSQDGKMVSLVAQRRVGSDIVHSAHH